MNTRHKLSAPRSIIGVFQDIPVRPFYLAACIAFVAMWLLPSGDWRLMAAAFTAFCFNTGTALLTLRTWPNAIAVLGLGLTYLEQSFALMGMCVSGAMGVLDEIGAYTLLLGREEWVLLMYCTVAMATLLALAIRRFLLGRQRPSAAGKFGDAATDPRLPIILTAAAGFSLVFWLGGELGFGLGKAVLGTLNRAFMFVPFLAGFYFWVYRPATVIWVLVVLSNVVLGTLTGSRGPAFVPIILYSLGVLMGATPRQRWIVLGMMVLLGIPGAFVFGRIESIRTAVGRLSVSEITSAKISEVVAGIKKVRLPGGDPYDELPAAVKANFRLVTWPTVVVAAATGANGGQRGFADLPQQIVASLNVVSVTGEMSGYYNEGLFNLRAADYGFRVDTGTSVEFGFLAESWDRGGPVAAFIYALTAIAFFWLAEAGVRSLLPRSPALRTVAVSVLFTTAFWTLNIYNLPLSLRQVPVNLVFCFVVFGLVSLLATKAVGRRPVEFVRGRRRPKWPAAEDVPQEINPG